MKQVVFALTILSTAFFLLPTAVRATGPVTATPGAVTASPFSASTVTLRWRVGVTARGPQTVTVSSPSGQFVASGASRSLGGAISEDFRHNGRGLEFFTITERLTIDRTTADLLTLGTGRFTRSFSDNAFPASASASASVTVRGSSGGPVRVRNIELQFDDASRFRVVGTNQALTARLNVTTAGTGIVAGSWEVSGPSATQGTGFRPMGRIRQTLAGSRRTVFESPPLPTRLAGTYRVRFVPDANGSLSGLEPPLAQYTVTPTSVAPSVSLSTPRAGAGLTPSTEFRWASVEGANAYRVEFFDSGAGGVGRNRLAAVDTPDPFAAVRGPTFARLSEPGPLYWRVAAFDAEGRVLAMSAFRQLRGGQAAVPDR